MGLSRGFRSKAEENSDIPNGGGMCRYQHMFGEPRKGTHELRIFDFALLDILQTLLGAFIISKIMHWNVLYVTIGLFLMGILAHRLFCVRTTMDRLLFP